MKQEYIDQIRAFNRFYTKVLGVLNKSYLGSEFGLPEIRVIQDVYLHPNRNAKEISRELNMDKGLLSRILKKLEANHSRHPPRIRYRAHLFYEKAGFKKIEKEELPIEYDYPYDDSDFFCLTLNGYQ